MAGSLNKVMLIGNLGADPEIKTFEGGNSIARLRIATSESYTSRQNNERVTQTEWHTVVLRRGLAEVAEKYLKKGDQVFIEGRIKTRSWDDANGEKRYATEIQGLNMTMLGSPRDGGGGSRPSQAQNASAPGSGPDFSSDSSEEDDLPF